MRIPAIDPGIGRGTIPASGRRSYSRTSPRVERRTIPHGEGWRSVHWMVQRMAKVEELIRQLTACRDAAASLVKEHCDPDKPEAWLKKDQQQAATSTVRDLCQSVWMPLSRLIGRDLAEKFCKAILGRTAEFVQSACKDGGSLQQLRWLYETNDIPVVFAAMEETLMRLSGGTPGERQEETPRMTPRRSRKPPDHYFAVYRLSVGTGWSQGEIAKMATKELKHPISQPDVSKIVKRVGAWLAQGNVLPSAENVVTKAPTPTDPTSLDAGQRTNRLTRRQRPDPTPDE